MFFMGDGLSEITQIIRSSQPDFTRLLRCEDIQSVFRSGALDLVDFLTDANNFSALLDVLLAAKDFYVVKQIGCLFQSPNTILLDQLIHDISYLEKFTSVLDSTGSMHRYVVGVITNALLRGFELWSEDLFVILNSSRIIYKRLIKTVHIPSVSHFLAALASSREAKIHYQPFVWISYTTLLGKHTLTSQAPKSCQNQECISLSISNLYHPKRKKLLDLICCYFGNFVEEEVEISSHINNGLAALLQAAYDDMERSLVFKLGILLSPNGALGVAALLIVNCFKSADILMQYALSYIVAFDVNLGIKSIELFVYRLLSRRKINNFLVLSIPKLITSLTSLKNYEVLRNNLRQIVVHCLQGNNSYAIRAYRACLLSAIDGVELDIETYSLFDIIHQYINYSISVDKSYIEILQYKSDAIEGNKDFRPTFNVKDFLNKNEVDKNHSIFNFLQLLDPGELHSKGTFRIFSSESGQRDIILQGNGFKKIIRRLVDDNMQLEGMYGAQATPQFGMVNGNIPISSQSNEKILLNEARISENLSASLPQQPVSIDRPRIGNVPLINREIIKEPFPKFVITGGSNLAVESPEQHMGTLFIARGPDTIKKSLVIANAVQSISLRAEKRRLTITDNADYKEFKNLEVELKQCVLHHFEIKKSESRSKSESRRASGGDNTKVKKRKKSFRHSSTRTALTRDESVDDYATTYDEVSKAERTKKKKKRRQASDAAHKQ